MHILMLAPHYAPYVGGAETHTRALAEALVRQGQDVTVLTDQGHRPLPAREAIGGVQVVRTTRSQLGGDATGRDSVRWEHDLFGLLADLEHCLTFLHRAPEVIHAQCQVSFLLGAMLKEHFNVPLVVTPHETAPEGDGLGEARTRALFTLPQIDAFIAGSKTFAAQAYSLGRTESASTMVVESGIDLQSWLPSQRSAVAPPNDQPTIVSIGRFKPRKNQAALIEAVALLKGKHPSMRCILAGSCDAGSVTYLKGLRDQTRQLDVGDMVQIVEDLTDDELRHTLHRADLVVQPALAEGLGLVAIKALAAGKPVLSTPTAGALEVLGEYPPLLIGGFEGAAIAASIHNYLCDATSVQNAAKQAARHVCSRFDAAVSSARILAVYRNLVGV